MNRNRIYGSTGTTVGRRNGYNIHLVTELFPPMMEAGIMDGAEFMMLPVYYDRMQAVAEEWLRAGIVFPVIHCEKEVGTLLSNAGKAVAAGEKSASENLCRQALEDFRRNCEMGTMVGSKRMVFHLWGGLDSDSHLAYNISILPELLEVARSYGMRLLIENVPCTTKDPLANWRELLPHLGQCGLVFDTRFGFFHRQITEIWDTESIRPHIEHIHIGDIRGDERDFSVLRPIYHPGEGMVDFPAVAQRVRAAGYCGSVTLESPVVTDGGADGEKLKASLIYVRRLFG